MQSKIISALILTNTLRSSSFILSRSAANLSFKVLGTTSADPEKTPIMLLHGFLGNKKIWHSMGKVMKNTMKRLVVTVDLRNHGVSPHTKSHTYEKMVGDIQQLYKKLSIDEAFLVGYCMGGMTAMCLSLLAPKLVSGLVIVEVSPASPSPFFVNNYPEVLKAMKAVDFKHPKTVRKARKRAKEQLKKIITDDNMMTGVLSNINLRDDNTIGWTCNLEVLQKHFDHISTFPKKFKGMKYRGPTLFIGGQTSDAIPPDDLTKIRMMFPQAIVHYVPQSGHFVHVDDPKTFMELVMNFVRETQTA
ncbi:protein ABHD11-like [Amyelois transitella]|uniref:protein ABHD11-like n=1 Tax=Amyelois transitella TaxID=680683 RepID=UPI00298FB881|nr:protein ABHD11-like [Amyelois transitella]